MTLSILFALNMLLLWCIDIFTFKPIAHEGTSGNGNLGLIFDILIIPFYICLLVLGGVSLYRMVPTHWITTRHLVVVSIMFGAILVLTITGEVKLYQAQMMSFGGDATNPDSIIYRYGALNQYSNTVFFNGYTFVMGVCLTLWAACLFRYMK
ncbi:hypothetical protein A8709_07545 [Paenibacillus pectinilyticus]|uniref:Uncharacterized protein n=1 Tax=Paenibacillus pectinilyticus TaxID=512399 RepID=A0A1C0ZTV7_9BACL|nr:hypothetical protein [Paenibacillus pectinilyticus]OCT11510.1 hypothetical protein A8709_07545 [Paenibacillus pectinilyticus]